MERNGADLEYQVHISWLLEWESQDVEASALAMYVHGRNTLAMAAAEGFNRRLPVEPTQPDSVVVGIGYPLSDSVYSPVDSSASDLPSLRDLNQTWKTRRLTLTTL